MTATPVATDDRASVGWHPARRVLVLLGLLITILVKFVPFYPAMPAAGLDWSYAWATNQAVAHGLTFGKQYIFNFGPYPAVYTNLYDPATYARVLATSLLLAVVYWLSLVMLMRKTKLSWILAYCVALAACLTPDTLLYSMPLVVGLLTYKTLCSDDGGWPQGRLELVYVTAVFSPLGLLPLTKSSNLTVCLAIMICCAAFLFARGRRLAAAACVVAPAGALVFFWLVSGQPIQSLPSYLSSTVQMTAGYTDAMSVAGSSVLLSPIELLLVVIACATIVFAILRERDLDTTSKLFLGATFSAFLFLSFKAGFVRQDDHALIAGSAVLLAAVLISPLLRPKAVMLVVVLALGAYLLPVVHYAGVQGAASGYIADWRGAWYGVQNSVGDRDWLRRDYAAAVGSLRREAGFPALSGTTDIYPYDQAYLFANGYTWAPRPVLQSYSAFSPALAAYNKNHLLGPEAPDNVIFAVKPIDGRFPSLDDGPSWPVLMQNYVPWHMTGDYLFLRKKKAAPTEEVPIGQTTETCSLGQSVGLPTTATPLFAQIDIRPTLYGLLSDFFLKRAELSITLQLDDGTVRRFRLVPGMAKAGFLVSPLVEKTTDFRMLYAGGGGLQGRRVRTFVVQRSGLQGRFLPWDWQNRYYVTFSQVAAN